MPLRNLLSSVLDNTFLACYEKENFNGLHDASNWIHLSSISADNGREIYIIKRYLLVCIKIISFHYKSGFKRFPPTVRTQQMDAPVFSLPLRTEIYYAD